MNDRPRSDPDTDVRCLSQVTNPVGAIAATREHVDTTVIQTEPDLYGVRFARSPSERREVREILVREAFEHHI